MSPLAQEAERLEYDSVWTAEAWGSDAFTPAAWIGAHTERIRLCTGIVQISARTPASCAMHALTLDHLSNGRFTLGLGVSGPQVVEGWYGQPFGKPLGAHARVHRDRAAHPARARSRSSSTASTTGCRTTARARGASASRCGRSRTRCAPTCRSCSARRARRTSQLAAEIADGWMPLYYSPFRQDVYTDSLQGAAGKPASRSA